MKYKFGDKVVIVGGFYDKIFATIIEFEEGVDSDWDKYYIVADGVTIDKKTIYPEFWIEENFLKRTDEDNQ